MNVYVVSFDESENADDPLLTVYASRVLMERRIRDFTINSSFRHEIDAALEESRDTGVDFTLMLWNDETEERMQIHVRQATVEEAETVLTKGAL